MNKQYTNLCAVKGSQINVVNVLMYSAIGLMSIKSSTIKSSWISILIISS